MIRSVRLAMRLMSLSLRRAWIEITHGSFPAHTLESLSLRRAWIEITRPTSRPHWMRSLSLRRAWIEILQCEYVLPAELVALLTESVD